MEPESHAESGAVRTVTIRKSSRSIVLGKVWLRRLGDVGDSRKLCSVHASKPLHSAHGILREPPGEDRRPQTDPVCGFPLQGQVLILLFATKLRQPSPLVSSPRRLDEAGSPCTPVIRIIPEKGTIERLTVEYLSNMCQHRAATSMLACYGQRWYGLGCETQT